MPAPAVIPWLSVLSEDPLSDSLDNVRNELRAVLRDRGLRATSVRLAVLVSLHERAAPMTHEQVMEVLPTGAFDRATVWRVLSDLAEQGVLRRMDLGDRIWRYELIDACRPVQDDHAHFLCEACGDVSCLPPLEVRLPGGGMPEALRGAEVRIRFTGVCSDCASA